MTYRPELHTETHDFWDQGGFCNELVRDHDDELATICGYRKPLPTASPAAPAISDDLVDQMVTAIKARLQWQSLHRLTDGIDEKAFKHLTRAAISEIHRRQAQDALLAAPSIEEAVALDDLIAEARRWPAPLPDDPTPAAAPHDLIKRLTDALEAQA